MLWYLRLDFVSAQPSRIEAEYVDCTSRIGAEFAELPSIIRRGLSGMGDDLAWDTSARKIADSGHPDQPKLY